MEPDGHRRTEIYLQTAEHEAMDFLELSWEVALVDAAGIEPATCRLRAECSAS
jgi:hypothetical protein